MRSLEGRTIIGVLGQWASGKSTASRVLIEYLGGGGKVVYLNDQHIFARQVVNYLLALEPSRVITHTEKDGKTQLDGDGAKIWLSPGEDLKTLDITKIQFDVPDQTLPDWLNRARIELARQLCEMLPPEKPIVIEAGYGMNPADHTIADLFLRFEEAGVHPKQVKWLVVEAGFAKRAERNAKRQFAPPVDVFARFAADGGALEPDHQKRLEEQGTIILRVNNDHDDLARFKTEIIAAVENL